MKLLGLALLLICALVISREYSRYVKKRIAECDGFISFIKHMRLEMKCFLRPPKDIGRGFESSAINFFISALEGEESVYLAYSKSCSALSLSLEERAPLEELFSSIGLCYADDGVRLIDEALERLEMLRGRLTTDGLRGTRVFKTVSAAVSVGLFILFI
jgi:hypothetical protein